MNSLRRKKKRTNHQLRRSIVIGSKAKRRIIWDLRPWKKNKSNPKLGNAVPFTLAYPLTKTISAWRVVISENSRKVSSSASTALKIVGIGDITLSKYTKGESAVVLMGRIVEQKLQRRSVLKS